MHRTVATPILYHIEHITQQSLLADKMFKVAGIFLLAISGVSGFTAKNVPSTHQQQRQASSSTSLNMMNVEDDVAKKVAGSFLAASFLFSNLAFSGPAFAADDNMSFDFGGSSEVLAGRGGGRSGGRAGGRSSAARAPPRSAAPSRVVERTTVIRQAPAPVYSSPSVIVAPPVYYNPVPGLGVSMGLNAIGNIGRDMQDARQESEIRSTQAELNQYRMREAEMEARLRQLEGQNQNNQNQQMLMQQQMMMQQQAAAAAAK